MYIEDAKRDCYEKIRKSKLDDLKANFDELRTLARIEEMLSREDTVSVIATDLYGNRITYTKKEQPMERKVFTYKDVMLDSNRFIGMKGYFTNSQKECDVFEFNQPYYVRNTDASSDYPFFDGEDWFQFFIQVYEPVEKLVPFTPEDWELFMGKCIRRNEWPLNYGICLIVHYSMGDVSTGNQNDINFTELLDRWTFMDGTPCGKKVVG